MKNLIFFLFFLIFSFNAFSQKDTLYLKINNPLYRYDESKHIFTGFSIFSKDPKFISDYYKFQVWNFNGWDDNGNDVLLDLIDLKKEIDSSKVKITQINEFTFDLTPCEIHENLSQFNRIFLVEFDSTKNIYFSIPVYYLGTVKNFIQTDLSK